MASVETRLRNATRRTERLEVEAERLAAQLRTAERELGDARSAYLTAREAQKAAVERGRVAQATEGSRDDKAAKAAFVRARDLERRNQQLAEAREKRVGELLVKVGRKEHEVESARVTVGGLEKELNAEIAAERARKGRVPSRRGIVAKRLLSGAKKAVASSGRAVARTAEAADKALETRQKARAERERLAKAKLRKPPRRKRKSGERIVVVIRDSKGFGKRKPRAFKRKRTGFKTRR